MHLFEFIAYMSVLGVIIFYAGYDILYHVPIDHYKVSEDIPSINETIGRKVNKVKSERENIIL